MVIRNLYNSMYHPQIKGQVECFNKTFVDIFMHYIEHHHDNWDELVSVLALAYISRPHRTTGVAPTDLVTPQRLRSFSLERMPDGMTPDLNQSMAEAKDAFEESLKALLPQARDLIDKTQARYKRDYEEKVRPLRVSLTSGDWVHLQKHTRTHKLDPKVTGPYEVLETDGRTYLIDRDGLAYRVSGDHVLPAEPVDPANRPKQSQVAVLDALRPGASDFVLSGSWTTPRTRSGSSGCWSAGLDMDRTTTPGDTRVACRLRRCTSSDAARDFSCRTQIRRHRVRMPRQRGRTAKRQQTLAYTSTTCHGSSLAKGPGTTPANAKHAHATYDNRHRPRTLRLNPDDDGSQTGPDKYSHNHACSYPECSAAGATRSSHYSRSGCRHHRSNAGGSQCHPDTLSRSLSRRRPDDHRCPTRGRAKNRPVPPAGGDSPVAAGGWSGGATAGRSRLNGTTPEVPPPERRGPPPGVSKTR